MTQTERVADCQHEVTDANGLGVADRHVDEFVAFDFKQRDIGCRIGADNFGIEHVTVDQGYLDLVRTLDDMVIRQDVAPLGVDDDAGAGARNFTRASRHLGQTEESSKRFVAERPAGLNGLADANIDDGRRHALDERCEAGNGFAVHACGKSCGGPRAHREQRTGSQQMESIHHVLHI